MSNPEQFPLATQRHSFAHMLAQAVQRFIDPDAQLGTWPAIETWCYYDIAFSDWITFKETDCKALTKSIQRICSEKQTFLVYACDIQEWYTINALTNQQLKNELLDKFQQQGEERISFYLNVVPAAVLEHARETAPWRKEYYTAVTAYFQEQWTIDDQQAIVFLDLCAWPHVASTKEDLDTGWCVVSKLAGAYRQADENNQMMTRIYMDIFANKEELKAYQTILEEAKKRDHRILWEKLKLFTISPLVGAWMPLLQPNWTILRQEIIDYLWELHKERWYQQVWTPHLAKEDLYVTSWHAAKFGDELFRVSWKEENDKFFIKPMNCPHHMQLYADNQFSYRDMPVRYFEPGTVYRDEKKWQLSGLTRVRSITQDDGHLFCRIGQINQEVMSIVTIIKEFYATIGMLDAYRVSLSVRGDDQSKYLWSNEVWDIAEQGLKQAADDAWLPYKTIPWEAAFYGPKLDFMFKDALGREQQLATIQCDFNLPERFDLTYINEQWEKERPVVIHRAISWSIERFMGVMIEHFAGAFPVWLAPVQAIILPVSDSFHDYAETIHAMLSTAWLRVKIDDAAESLNKKIRNAELLKIPYMLILWEKEQTDNTVSVRVYATKEQYTLPSDEFCTQLLEEYTTRSLGKSSDQA